MKRLKELREKLEQLRLASLRIVELSASESRELTDDERKDLDAMKEEMEPVRGDIVRLESVERDMLEATKLKDRQTPVADPAPTADPPPDDDQPKPRAVSPHHGPLRAFKGDGAERRANRCGHFVKAACGNGASLHWCRDNGVALMPANETDMRAMGETVNSAGGFTVPDEFSAAVIDIKEEYGVFRRNARKWNMVRDSLKIPRSTSAGLTVYALGENPAADITESDASFDQVSLNIKEWATNTRVSNTLLADTAINLADYLADRMGYAYALKEDQCGFIGDGTDTYQGILGIANKFNANTGYKGHVAAAAGLNTIPEITIADIVPVLGQTIPGFWGRSRWYMSAVMWNRIETLLAAAGGNTIATLQSGATGRAFMGFPVELAQVLPSNLTTDYDGLSIAIFGDLSSSSSLGDRAAMTLMVDPYTYAGRNQTRFVSVARWDIITHDIGSATEAGPVAVLAGGTA